MNQFLVCRRAFYLVEKRGAVGIATLNRPEKHNAMSAALGQQLYDAIEEFEAAGIHFYALNKVRSTAQVAQNLGLAGRRT